MKTKTRMLLFLLFIPGFFPVKAQTPVTGNIKDIETLMEDKIRLLKNGALLVRLKTKEQSVAALRKAGQHAEADKVEKQQKTYNKDLIAAFRSEYKFSPVYFFTSDQTETILSGAVSNVVFVNDSVVADPAIHLEQTEFLIAESGTLEPDTATYFEGQYYDYGVNSRSKKDAYYGSSNMGIDAIRIMNNRFVQLKSPFPYYVRLYSSLPVKRNLAKAVEKLNLELKKYHDQVTR